MKQIIITKDTMSADFAELGKYIDDNIGDSMMIIEVRKYNAQLEISHNQMKYIHCDNGPIKMYANHYHYSLQESELYLKRECGEHLFIRELTGATWFELCELKGKAYYECKSQVCSSLLEPKTIQLDKIDGKRICPKCSTEVRVISILSKTELTTKQTNDWIDSMYTFLTEKGVNIQLPNKEWRSERE